MISENRKFSHSGLLNIHRSRVLNEGDDPKDDIVNWLFLDHEGHLYGFVYKIVYPNEATYESNFEILLSFTVQEVIKTVISLNSTYPVLRGQELIGSVKILKYRE